MAAPTAIPHPENSTHHHQHATGPPRSNSPPLVSPVYSRTAFSLPGAPTSGHQSSFRNTANGGWAPAGVGAMSGSPTKVSTGGFKTQASPQRDTFPERRGSIAEAARHSRAFSGSSSSGASLSSSVSSVESFGGPPTPRTTTNDSNASAAATSGAPLGRVHSIPLATSPYEAIKARRESWSNAGAPSSPPGAGGGGWPGFGLLRGNRSPPALHKEANDMVSISSDASGAAATTTSSGGGMGSLFRKLSVGAGANPAGHTPHRPHHHGHHHGHRSASVSAVEAPTTPTATPTPKGRGRQASVSGGSGTGSTAKRKPSPHGERLLMGWTHAH